ncbi:hypothetical protein KBD81_06065, partial [Candidatus Woesebacteria bacterium]|nr:hypothetical protein [Candidatus Woesebacteria bacterium]
IIDKRNKIVANIETAVETLLDAGNPRIFVVTIPDWGDHTAVKVGFPLPHLRLGVTDAIRDTNNSIQKLSTLENVEVVDIQTFYKGLRTSENNYQVIVGGVALDQYISQNNPHSAYLRDGVHTGTVINGLLANCILNSINNHLTHPINQLSSHEILKTAGIEK